MGGTFGVKCVKVIFFFKNLHLYSGAWFIQTQCIVKMTKDGSTTVVKFMTPGGGVLVQGCGLKGETVKMHYFIKNLLLYYQA